VRGPAVDGNHGFHNIEPRPVLYTELRFERA